jgi:hypothetical protein
VASPVHVLYIVAAANGFASSLMQPVPIVYDPNLPPSISNMNYALSLQDLFRQPRNGELVDLAASWVYETWYAEEAEGNTRYYERDADTQEPGASLKFQSALPASYLSHWLIASSDREFYEMSSIVVMRSYCQKLQFLHNKFQDFDEIVLDAAACIIHPRWDPYRFLDPVLRMVKAYYDHQLPVRSPVAWNSEELITNFAYVYGPEEPELTGEEETSRGLLFRAIGHAGADPLRARRHRRFSIS